MNHLGTKRIETDRLILRPFTLEDAQAMYDNWASDPEVTKFLTWPTYEKKETADHILSLWTKDYEKPDFYQWAIELKELGQPIGSISVVELREDVGRAEIGYCIGKTWWGRGLMPETLKAVMDFLFDEVGCNRVEATHDVRNPNSGRVMAKCGMKQEGILRQYSRNNQGICDVCWHSLVKQER